MPAPLLAGQAFHRRLQGLFQFVEAGIHDLLSHLLELDVNALNWWYFQNFDSYHDHCSSFVPLVKIGTRAAFLPCGFLYIVVTKWLTDGARVAPLKSGGGSEPRIPLGD